MKTFVSKYADLMRRGTNARLAGLALELGALPIARPVMHHSCLETPAAIFVPTSLHFALPPRS